MNLTWHITKKDLIRLWIPFTIWVGSLLVTTISDALQISTDISSVVLLSVSNFGRLASWALTVFLSAKMILEDPLTTTAEFWRTRPISGLRLLLAKLTELGALVTIPLILFAGLLICVGVKGSDVGLALVESALSRAAVVVGIAAIAAVSSSFGSFSLRAFAVIIGTSFLASIIGSIIWTQRAIEDGPPISESLGTSAVITARFLSVIIGGGLLALRYFSCQTRFAIVNVFVAGLIVSLIPTFWPWDFIGSHDSRTATPISISLSSPILHVSQNQGTPSESAAVITSVEGRIDIRQLPGGEWLVPKTVYGVYLWGAGGFRISTDGAMSRIPESTGPIEALDPTALQSCLGTLQLINSRPKPSVPLHLFNLNRPLSPSDGPFVLRASVAAARYRFNIEAEIPLGSGASIREDQLRIMTTRPRLNDHELKFTVMDREFQPALFGRRVGNRLFNPLPPMLSGPDRGLSGDLLYVLANRARGEAAVLHAESFSQSSLGGLSSSVGHLNLNLRDLKIPLDASWLMDATLLRVRAVELGSETCVLEASNLTMSN